MKGGWPFTAPLSLLYGGVVTLRNLLYDKAILNSADPEIKVISVGNITAGGSGKTPLTIALAAEIKALKPDLKIAVVSRGYGRSTKGVQVVSNETEVLMDATSGGDEPFMIANALPGFPVVVSEKRINGIRFAREEFGTELVILDDGFQHRKVKRDLDIVILDSSAPSWTWRPLPGGYLRDMPSSLRRAGLIVMTGVVNSEVKYKLHSWIRKFSDTDILHGGIAPSHLKNIVTGEEKPLTFIKGKKIIASAAIARPERFFSMLKGVGAELLREHKLRDHAWMTSWQREEMFEKALSSGCEAVIITGKDAVKWPNSQEFELPVYIFETEWQWWTEEEVLNDTLIGILES